MKRIYNVLNGNISVPDGKIDTSQYQYDIGSSYNSGVYRICRERVDYEPDYLWEELYLVWDEELRFNTELEDLIFFQNANYIDPIEEFKS